MPDADPEIRSFVYDSWKRSKTHGIPPFEVKDKRLSEEELSFDFDCSRERFENALLTLGKDELQAIKDEDHGAEIICQFCQNKYEFSEADLEELIND